jgi:hypothetical protein
MQGRGTNHCNKELMKISHVSKDFVALTDRNIWERISLTYGVYICMHTYSEYIRRSMLQNAIDLVTHICSICDWVNFCASHVISVRADVIFTKCILKVTGDLHICIFDFL